jgi:hypothetical protein
VAEKVKQIAMWTGSRIALLAIAMLVSLVYLMEAVKKFAIRAGYLSVVIGTTVFLYQRSRSG